MPSIPVTTPLGYIGVFFVIAGFFLVIAGIELIKIEKLTITPGRKTWGIGLLLAAIGVLFLLPDIFSIIPSSPTPTAFDTVVPNTVPPFPASTGIITPIVQLSQTSTSTIAPNVQPTSTKIVPPVETPTSMSQTLRTPTVVPLSPQPVVCVTPQSGTGAPVEVQADTLKATDGDGLKLVSGELIPFSIMRNFEVNASEYPDHLRVTITLLNGDMVIDDVSFLFDRLKGKAKYGPFDIALRDVKRVEFHQGSCQEGRLQNRV